MGLALLMLFLLLILLIMSFDCGSGEYEGKLESVGDGGDNGRDGGCRSNMGGGGFSGSAG